MLEVGALAPDFTLEDGEGRRISLSDFRGRSVVVYFYSKDNTSGCTRQACAFRDAYADYRERGVEVIGISRDGAASHRNFISKHSLPFVLLSDPELEVARAYGAYGEKKLYGKVTMGVIRTTYVIDGEGRVIAAMPKVKPDTNASEILEKYFS